MSHDIVLLLIGAAIALGSSVITALAQHLLSLRAEKIKRRWEKEEIEAQEFRKGMLEGARVQDELVRRKIKGDFTGGALFRRPQDSETESKELTGDASETQEKEKET